MDKIIILDFGGQYCHLISRRIRDLGVLAEILPAVTTAREIKKIGDVRGIILSGGAKSVYDQPLLTCDKGIFNLNIPILGICYGHQLIAHLTGGTVKAGRAGEYGPTVLNKNKENKLLANLKKMENVWMNHRDIVTKLPLDFLILATTNHSPIAAFASSKRKIYGVQFHPEVTHTLNGQRIISNFVLDICCAKKGYSADNLAQTIISEIKQKIGASKAIIGLSGGIDSSVAAVLAKKAIGNNLTAVYVDTGLMRHREAEFIKKTFSKFGLNLKIARAQKLFFSQLAGVVNPEKKRKTIGKLFIDVFNDYARKINAEVLIQGTIYSDRIESGATKHSANIKSHHNVGGLPKKMKLALCEPLADLYKDEVRNLARKLKLPDELINRHVFPGPGMAIRIVGEVTPERARIVRQANFIVEEELKKAKLYERVWMGFAVLLAIKNVGVEGDARSYRYPVVVRVISSKDAMTANFYHLPHSVLAAISTRITNEIKAVNRVVYDISNKPPATMEWE